MNIAVIGINHNLSPINIREKVSFTDTKNIEATNILLDKDLEEIAVSYTHLDDTLKYMRNIIDEDTKNKIKSAY